MVAIRVLLVVLMAAVALALQGQPPVLGATLTVSKTTDTNDGVCDADCSLREAITVSNASTGTLDTIAFSIPGAGPHTIQPASALPTITDPVIIDGTTEPDFAGTPVVELDGSGAGGATGLTITAGDTTVRGLVINRFGLFGVHLSTAGNNTIVGNYIGTNVAGTADLGNNSVGVVVSSADNTIGGSASSNRNIISGNNASGVELNGAVVTGNVVQGNYIGTDVTGAVDLGNNFHGVLLNSGVSNNTVGGAAAGEGNVISGNGLSGVSTLKAAGGTIEGVVSASSVTNNTVQGNYIGTDAAGTAALGNDGDGIIITSAGNTIGGTAAGAGNVISGNGGNGVLISGVDASVNILEGNYVGTDSTGGTALGNSQSGVRVNSAPSNTVGGTASGARNVISANGIDGVEIIGALATGNQVLGNYIGTDAGGTVDLGNADDGVELDAAPNNTVGGPAAGASNLISGNNSDGVLIFQVGATGNQVLGNYIGTDASGTSDLGNGSDGVRIEGAPSNTVGGTTAAERDLISGNGVDGVEIVGGGAIKNMILGNYIGTDVTGTVDLGNSNDGVLINGATNNTIGGTAAGVRQRGRGTSSRATRRTVS